MFIPPITIATFLIVALWGCNDVSTDPEVALSSDTAEMLVFDFGHPEGTPALPPVSGVYPPEIANDPEAIKAQVAIPMVGISMTNMTASASSWEEAHERLQTYLADPPPAAADVPHYILEQIAALSMYYETSLFEGEPSAQKKAATATYLDYVVRNRTPHPQMVADMLRVIEHGIPATRKQDAARAALDAFEAHEERTALCDGCTLAGSDSPGALKKAARDAQALRDLRTIAES